MKRVLFAFLFAALVAGCGAGTPDNSGFPSPAGWKPAGEARQYGSDELWAYINGAADAFLAYGFRQVEVRDFSAGEIRLSVAIYDMGTPLNAFGIYRTELPPGQATLAVGAEAAMIPPYQGLLLKDASYVKVEVLDGSLSEEEGEKLLRDLAAALPGPDGLPAAVQALPAEGRVAGSEGYALESYLGLSDLKSCIHANYRDETGGEYKVFLLVPEGEETLDSIWDSLGERWESTEGDTAILTRRIPYRGMAGITRTEAGLLGVADLPDLETAVARLALLRK